MNKDIKDLIDISFEEELKKMRNPLNEMAKLNIKEGSKSLFPANRYNVIVQGDNSKNKVPHIHIKSAQEKFDIRVYIETGELWSVKNYGTRKKRDKFVDIITNIKKWLNMPSTVPMAKGDTNREFAMNLWELNNP